MEKENKRVVICPICGKEMKTVQRYNVEIDICENCKGVWLDRGELNKIINTVSDIYNNLLDFSVNKGNRDNTESKNYLTKIFELDEIQ